MGFAVLALVALFRDAKTREKTNDITLMLACEVLVSLELPTPFP